ncbi:MAG: ABC transporter ATP-binding protein [Bradymonadales bacterium]|nr:ABC transporter ATP-binding protein [Bradymonadales bacterium]
MSGQGLLEVKEIVKRYGPLTAVDGISLRLSPGELVAFIGPNGAGKTTTYRCIVGLQRPDAGQVLVSGLDMQTDRVEALRAIGYVGQDVQLFQYLTGEETLRMVGEIYQIEPQQLEDRISRLLELLELGSAANRLVRHYSGGMARKLALCTALVREPPVLLLDESFAGLDPESTVAIRGELDRLRQNGSTILLSSHVLELLERWVTRVVILAKGRIVQDLGRSELNELLSGRFDSLTSLYLYHTRQTG